MLKAAVGGGSGREISLPRAAEPGPEAVDFGRVEWPVAVAVAHTS
jgi:hypothetical protein